MSHISRVSPVISHAGSKQMCWKDIGLEWAKIEFDWDRYFNKQWDL